MAIYRVKNLIYQKVSGWDLELQSSEPSIMVEYHL